MREAMELQLAAMRMLIGALQSQVDAMEMSLGLLPDGPPPQEPNGPNGRQGCQHLNGTEESGTFGSVQSLCVDCKQPV